MRTKQQKHTTNKETSKHAYEQHQHVNEDNAYLRTNKPLTCIRNENTHVYAKKSDSYENNSYLYETQT